MPTRSGERSGVWPSRLGQESGSEGSIPEGKLCEVPVDPGQAQLVAGLGPGRACCVTHAIPCFVLSKP